MWNKIKNIFSRRKNKVKMDLPSYYEIALLENGISEVVGKKHNPRVLEYHKSTTLEAKDDETSWCSSFVNWCLDQAGLKGTNSAAARSWLTFGEDVTKTPQIGDIVVFWRESKNSWKGHVGFYAGETLTHIEVFGGNQDNKVCFKKYPKLQLLSIRRPKN